ncbi:MAG: preprotein translocase subunit SecG [Spirochaetes bacterium]|nr:preprotein translocase subunit SecG [Spirochaetota bacterium]
MEMLLSISNVLFVVLAVLLIIIILLQSDKSAGMGVLGGSSQTAFGSSTADVITKITTVMVALFMLGALGLAILQSYKEGKIEKAFKTEGEKAVIEDAKSEEKKDAQPAANKAKEEEQKK